MAAAVKQALDLAAAKAGDPEVDRGSAGSLGDL